MRRTTTECPGLAVYRAARGGTIEHEAQLSGVARQTWYRWENGLTRPTRAQLEAVAKRWRVSLDALTSPAAAPEALSPVRALVEEHGAEDVRSALALVSGTE